MHNGVGKIMLAVLFAATASVQANAKNHSESIVVVSPLDLPEIAQRSSEDMYLHETGGGRTILYLEQDQGRTLAVLDVSDPGIRAVAQVPIAARSPYDFVETLSDSAALIHYRDNSGFAVINFKKFKKPVLTEAPQFQHPAYAEPIGDSGLLLASTTDPAGPAAEGPKYQVFDVSNPSNRTALATVEGVQQRLERTETGTLFLLSNKGLTVIRRPNKEEEYKFQSTYIN